MPNQHPIESFPQSNAFAKQYFEHLSKREAETVELLRQCLEGTDSDKQIWSDRLSTLVSDLDHRAITDKARRRGLVWFCATPQEGAQYEDY